MLICSHRVLTIECKDKDNAKSGKSYILLNMILMQDDAIAIKLRLPDHRQRLSRKDGYRLIYLVSMIEERVAFLDILSQTWSTPTVGHC